MATYRLKNEIEIAEPCSENWEAMDGDARTRHCAACACDVHNLAAMTPRQIEAMLAAPGSLPCVRVARYEDGSLLVAEEQRASPPYGVLAGAAMAALVTISSGVAGAQERGRTMGKMAPPRATYSGKVVDPEGKPAAGSTVYVVRRDTGHEEREEVKTDAEGNFQLTVRTGTWQLGATGAEGQLRAAMEQVTLKPGSSSATKPVQLRVITVTAGVPAMVTPRTPKGK